MHNISGLLQEQASFLCIRQGYPQGVAAALAERTSVGLGQGVHSCTHVINLPTTTIDLATIHTAIFFDYHPLFCWRSYWEINNTWGWTWDNKWIDNREVAARWTTYEEGPTEKQLKEWWLKNTYSWKRGLDLEETMLF